MRDRLSPFTWKGETTVKKCETCFASRYFEIFSSNVGQIYGILYLIWNPALNYLQLWRNFAQLKNSVCKATESTEYHSIQILLTEARQYMGKWGNLQHAHKHGQYYPSYDGSVTLIKSSLTEIKTLPYSEMNFCVCNFFPLIELCGIYIGLLEVNWDINIDIGFQFGFPHWSVLKFCLSLYNSWLYYQYFVNTPSCNVTFTRLLIS